MGGVHLAGTLANCFPTDPRARGGDGLGGSAKQVVPIEQQGSDPSGVAVALVHMVNRNIGRCVLHKVPPYFEWHTQLVWTSWSLVQPGYKAMTPTRASYSAFENTI